MIIKTRMWGSRKGLPHFYLWGGQRLRYKELGTIHLNNYEGDFYQSYHYDFPEPGALKVSYITGDTFYRVDSPDEKIRVACGADIYEGSIFMVSENKWLQTWRVNGPHKKYHMVVCIKNNSAASGTPAVNI